MDYAILSVHVMCDDVDDEVLPYVHRKTVGLLGTGAQDVHLDFHTVPGL